MLNKSAIFLLLLYLAGPALAEPFDADCIESLAQTLSKANKRDKADIGQGWRAHVQNQFPWDHGHLDAMLQDCRSFGFSEGPRWNEMVKRSERWVHPAGENVFSRDKAYEDGWHVFQKRPNDYTRNGKVNPACECINGLLFYGPRGVDLSETLRYKKP